MVLPGAAQAKKIDQSLASLEKLRADARRRRYRDGWEALAKDLDAASRLAGPRAAEAALLSARVREEQWDVSRATSDAKVAVAAYAEVDERFPQSAEAPRALTSAVKLAVRTKLPKAAAAAARRLREQPRSPEGDAALALVKLPAREKPAAAAKPVSAVAAARAAQPSDRAAQRPAEDDDEEEAAEEAPAPAAAPAKAKEPQPSRSSARAARHAPPSPHREPDSDVPAAAAKALEALVRATQLPGAEDLLEGRGSEQAKAGAEGQKAPANAEPAAQPGTAAEHHPHETEIEEDGEGALPEPEAPELPPVPGPTRASAPRDADPLESDPDLLRRARELRALLVGEGRTPVAAQLGLRIRKVVVDAGHGGRDTGAIGKSGLREKDVALAIARKVAARLQAQGLEVVLTRDKDEHLTLEERTRIANDEGADLFLSIHCNSAKKRTLSGVETWTLNVAADRYAQRLAAFENADAGRRVSDLKMILADLFTKANASDARELATSVQSSLVRTLRSRVGPVKDNGVKQALFYVLLGAKMPAVLVETAFLSNPAEEKRLKSAKFQDATADAVARGVKEFMDARRRLAMAP